jgi:hypothetical protein
VEGFRLGSYNVTAIGRLQSFVAKVKGYERRLDIVEFFKLAEITNTDLIETLKALIEIR